MSLTLTISAVPPSLNGAYLNIPGKGRVPTKKLSNWKKLAGWELIAQRVKRIEGPIDIELTLKRPCAHSDVDNRIKFILDALVSSSVIDDDRNVQSIKASWAKGKDAPACVVVITSINE